MNDEEIIAKLMIVNDLLSAALIRLENAAENRENIMGDVSSLLVVKAELRAAVANSKKVRNQVENMGMNI